MSTGRSNYRRIGCVTLVALLALPQLFNVVELRGLQFDWDWISGQSSYSFSTMNSFINDTEDSISVTSSSSSATFANPIDSLEKRAPIDDEYRSDLVYLPLLPWELKSMEQRICTPPIGIPSYCCLGSLSAGGKVDFEPTACNKGIDAYNFTEIAALEELLAHPVSDYHFTPCDSCRIVDLLLQNNWTLAFQGDSITRQTFMGLECELRRRGYSVVSEEIFRPELPKPHWRFVLDVVNELRIRKNSTDLHSDNVAIVRLYGLYRPAPDMVEIVDIANSNDLLIFDHGLHYGPASKNEFYEDMLLMLNAILTNATQRLKLLAWRETSAQHFDTPGGEFFPNGPTDRCVPLAPEDVDRGKRLFHMMQQVMNDAGIQQDHDLVIFPFRTYTSQFHDLKGNGDCSHFCSSPALWLPLWRMMRIAMDSISA